VELIQIYIHAEEHAEIAELRLLHIEGVKKDTPLDLFEENGRNNRRYGDYVVSLQTQKRQ